MSLLSVEFTELKMAALWLSVLNPMAHCIIKIKPDELHQNSQVSIAYLLFY
jgi:hypothetical protein